ncbi:MAG: glycoside hydrolase [Thermoleophilia bacterium]|nr:glycoside hydrolase [Thermoleophilia bacterium]
MKRPLRVLVLARLYPNAVTPATGLWIERPTRLLASSCELKVVAAVPFCPPLPLPRIRANREYRDIPAYENRGGVAIIHPRFVPHPSRHLLGVERRSYTHAAMATVTRLRRTFPFDLVHAHFTYPEGVVAAMIGRRHGVPYMITEHAPWKPWFDDPRFRKHAVPAARGAGAITAVSAWARETMRLYLPEKTHVRIVPEGVDPELFPLEEAPRSKQVVYAGALRTLKAVDVLLRAMRLVIGREPRATLVLAGADFRDETRPLKALAAELGLDEQARFVGLLPPDELARLMGQSAVLVLPSRQETFGAVLVESLACGTPVVATRPGGPEDIVTDDVGRLVQKDDPEALADAILGVLAHPEAYEPRALRSYAVERFSWNRIAEDMYGIYEEILGGSSGKTPMHR